MRHQLTSPCIHRWRNDSLFLRGIPFRGLPLVVLLIALLVVTLPQHVQCVVQVPERTTANDPNQEVQQQEIQLGAVSSTATTNGMDDPSLRLALYGIMFQAWKQTLHSSRKTVRRRPQDGKALLALPPLLLDSTTSTFTHHQYHQHKGKSLSTSTRASSDLLLASRDLIRRIQRNEIVPLRVGRVLSENNNNNNNDDQQQQQSILRRNQEQDLEPSLYRNTDQEYPEKIHCDVIPALAGMKFQVVPWIGEEEGEQYVIPKDTKDPPGDEDGDENEHENENVVVVEEKSEFTFRSRTHHAHPPPAGATTTTSTAHLLWEQTYELVEPMHLELGIPPKHYWDYAYTPVYSYLHAAAAGGGTSATPTMTTSSSSIGDDKGSIEGRGGGSGNDISFSSAATTPGSSQEEVKEPARIAQEEHPYSCLAIGQGDQVEAPVTCTTLEKELQFAEDQDSWWQWWFAFGSPWWRSNQQSEYTTSRTAFAGGSHGQVWKGRRVCDHRHGASSNDGEYLVHPDCDEDQPLILKRLKVEQGYRLLEAGLREIYFGQWAQKLSDDAEKDLFTSYVDHFFRELPRSDGSKDLELWIVFEDAGPSLRSYIYAPVASSGGFVMFQHSPLWAQLRMTSRKDWKTDNQNRDTRGESEGTIEVLRSPSQGAKQTSTPANGDSMQSIGRELLRTVLKQIISAAAILHERGIVHRDIKPSNVMCVSDEPLDNLYALSSLPNIQCRLGDFSSGWDEYTNGTMYTRGPSPAEQTDEYAPPESYIDPRWKPFDERSPQSYDSWSIGVLALELLLGTPNVFSVDQRTTVLLTSKMKKKGASHDEVNRALYLAALSQFCIYIPSSHDKDEHSSWPYRQGDPLHKTAMAKDSCTMQDFHRALRARDPLGMGFDSSTDLLLHLIWKLLAWNPIERITAAEALQHPFFLSPDGTREALDMIPGRHNALESQMLDPRMDIIVDGNVDEFVCPKCGRTFADWNSCNAHATSRRHAKFCSYDRTRLPSCINTHSMLPAHPTSGYCDLQGRRATIEDFHSIHLYPEIQFYGIFDGHTGNVASKYAASTLFDRLVMHLPELGLVSSHRADGSDWKLLVEHNVSRAYKETHKGFLDALAWVPAMDQSGTTATALLVTKQAIVLSSLGDSRAVLSSTDESGNLSAIQLTIDHVASDPKEREMVLARGGQIFSSSAKGLARVNGTLAITRSIGDAALASMLSRRPHVTSMNRKEIQDLCGSIHWDIPCFIILASDGLWDVMTNQEAVDMVAQIVTSYDATDHTSRKHGGAFQEAAEVLAVDAFVRGSTDNIGVCVVAIS